MILATGPFTGLGPFLQVFLWIGLSFLLLATVITALIHLWAKRKTEKHIKEGDALSLGSPEDAAFLRGFPGYTLAGHDNLIEQYKIQLTSTTAKYMVLKQDISRLRDDYFELKNNSVVTKNDVMNDNAQNNNFYPGAGDDHAKQKNELIHQLQQVNMAYESLEKENQALLQQIDFLTANHGDGQEPLEEWKKEKVELKSRIADQEFLKDVIEEKNMQIVFLQNQLEQRIRNYHQLEQQHSEVVSTYTNVKEKNEESEKQLEIIKTELESGRVRYDELQASVQKDEKQREEWLESVRQKDDRIIYLENELKERIKQNELLCAQTEDNRDLLTAIREELEYTKDQVEKQQQKLDRNREWLRKLYHEMGHVVEAGSDDSPVIKMVSA
ncbi:MAG: hypothetical protein HC867_06055 [Bacteroidia bacterium]|nr:hypothetical protein [Bacteroidia bacterium]